MTAAVVFWLGSIFCIPLGVFACQFHKAFRYLFISLMFISLLIPEALSINFFSEENYKMASRGFEVHLVDLCALVLFFDILLSIGRRKIIWFPPLTILTGLFILVAIVSWMLVDGARDNPLKYLDEDDFLNPDFLAVFKLKLYPLFEISKLFRGYLVYWVTVNSIQDKKVIEILKALFVLTLIYFTINGLYMRYILGIHRISAGIGHYNNFNTFVGLLGAFILPWAYYTDRIEKSLLYWFSTLCALICIILSISRTALAGFGIVFIFGVPLLAWRFMSSRNAIFTAIFCFISLLGGLKAADSLFERFQVSAPTLESLHNREKLNKTATLMANDFPFGVGLGNFSAWSVLKYAYITDAEKGNFAHNTFYLTAAEVGYPGVFLFACIWIRIWQVLIQGLISNYVKHDPFWYSTLMGVFLGVIFLVLQLWFQFTYRVTPVYMLIQMLIGIGIRVSLDARAAEKNTSYAPVT